MTRSVHNPGSRAIQHNRNLLHLTHTRRNDFPPPSVVCLYFRSARFHLFFLWAPEAHAFDPFQSSMPRSSACAPYFLSGKYQLNRACCTLLHGSMQRTTHRNDPPHAFPNDIHFPNAAHPGQPSGAKLVRVILTHTRTHPHNTRGAKQRTCNPF